MQALAGYNYPITGAADLFLQAAGTQSEVRGDRSNPSQPRLAYSESSSNSIPTSHFAHGELASITSISPQRIPFHRQRCLQSRHPAFRSTCGKLI